jgi:hypothetical protein
MGHLACGTFGRSLSASCKDVAMLCWAGPDPVLDPKTGDTGIRGADREIQAY